MTVTLTASDPLERGIVPIDGHNENGITCIGEGWSDTFDVSTISNGDILSRHISDLIPEVVIAHGYNSVREILIELSFPLYEKIALLNESDKLSNKVGWMAEFWYRTVPGNQTADGKSIAVGRRNRDLALKYGTRAIYGPILSLGMAHLETKASPNLGKYFASHALRMGYIVNRFGIATLPVYVESAKQLLYHGVNDLSAELRPDQWEMLALAVHKYGFKEAYTPMIEAMCAVGDIPGTKEMEYHYSWLPEPIWALMPWLLPRLVKDGPNQMRKDLWHITNFIRSLHKEGAFTSQVHRLPKNSFFYAFNSYLPQVEQEGIETVLESTRLHWTSKLVLRS